MPPRLGAHMSIAGGVDRAVDRACVAGCQALQVFTRSASQWAARPLRSDECARFRAKVLAARLHPVLAHGAYLVNVASPDAALRRRSIEVLDDDLGRCASLGIPFLVMHPGAHVGGGETEGLARIAGALDELHGRRGPDVMILLENTAGQGSCLGHSFEQLAAILDRIRAPDRVGICVDTAHCFAAGYDLSTSAGWESTWRAFERTLGWARLRALHVNDAKKPLGSRVDRHEHIGLGHLGPAAFWQFMNDPRFDGCPASLETAKTDEGPEDVQNLAVLRRMVGAAGPPGRVAVRAWRAAAARAHAWTTGAVRERT